MLEALAQNAAGIPAVAGTEGVRTAPSAGSVARFNAALQDGSVGSDAGAVASAGAVAAAPTTRDGMDSLTALVRTTAVSATSAPVAQSASLLGTVDGTGLPVAAVRDGASLVDGQPLASMEALPPSTAVAKLTADVRDSLRGVSQSWQSVAQNLAQTAGANGEMSLAALTKLQVTALGAMFQIDLATKIITKPPQIIDQLVKTQ
jgi:hypothetical protein